MKKQLKHAGPVIRSLRHMASLTLEEVAAGADTSVTYLSKVETEKLTPTSGYVARVTNFISAQMMKDAA